MLRSWFSATSFFGTAVQKQKLEGEKKKSISLRILRNQGNLLLRFASPPRRRALQWKKGISDVSEAEHCLPSLLALSNEFNSSNIIGSSWFLLRKPVSWVISHAYIIYLVETCVFQHQFFVNEIMIVAHVCSWWTDYSGEHLCIRVLVHPFEKK